MKKLIQIIKEIFKQDIFAIRDWIDSDYNKDIGYNKNVNINKLINLLSNYKSSGVIYRVLGIPKNIKNEYVYNYIKNNISDRFASFSYSLNGAKYFAQIFLNPNYDKIVYISQNSSYYDLDEWYQDNFDELDKLLKSGEGIYSWIENLSEIENTLEVIAKQNNNFKIIKIEN